MPLSSRYYVVRPVDQIFRQAIERQESIIFLKGPRHTGKTSLLTHGLRQMREEGRKVVLMNFRELTCLTLETLDVFYRALAQSFADQLGLDAPPDRAWSSYRGPNENFERYLRLEILARHTTGLVWAIDEVDRIFPYSFSTEVFAMFRSWHNARALEFTGSLERLTTIMALSTETHLFMDDFNQPLFPIGTPITMEDFALEHVAHLNQLYGLPLPEGTPLLRFFRLVGGHPYLVHRGLHEIATRNMGIASFEAQVAYPSGCYGDHLQRLLRMLSGDISLRRALCEILQGLHCPDSDSFYRLKGAGIVVGPSPLLAKIRCLLYQVYLEAHLM